MGSLASARASTAATRGGWPMRRLAAAFGLVLAAWGVSSGAMATTAATSTQAALVTQDRVALRAAPAESAAVQTLLWRGEALELRGLRGDFVQVWDHHRERGGYVRAAQLMSLSVDAAQAPRLLALLAFVSEQPGAEPLGLALAAASIQAMPAASLQGPEGAAVLDAIGRQAERLAERASEGNTRPGETQPSAQQSAQLAAHLDVARRHGVQLQSREHEGRMRVCYDGDVYRRLLAMPAAQPEQKARAALGLTRAECAEPLARAAEREAQDLGWIDPLTRADTPALAPHWRSRLAMRQAEVWSRLAFTRAQRGEGVAAREAAEKALLAIGRVDRSELVDEDLTRFQSAAVRVNAVRWAAAGASAAPGTAVTAGRLTLRTRRADDGQTCVSLHAAAAAAEGTPALAERCTWGQVWTASAAPNRQGTALALAVQPIEGWRELWVFRQDGAAWSVQVLPPAALQPGIGYAEFAGWEPSGQRLLVAREALAEGRTIRRFEVVALGTLVAERTAFTADALGPFARWPDPAWKRDSLALR